MENQMNQMKPSLIQVLTLSLGLASSLLLMNCAPKDRGYGLNSPGFNVNALSLQSQSPQYVRHSLASLDHTRSALEMVLATPAVKASGCHSLTRGVTSTQAPDLSANSTPTSPAPALLVAETAPPAPAPETGASPIHGRVESLLLKYNNCTEKSALVSRGVQTGQEYFVVTYASLGADGTTDQVMPNSVTSQIDLRYQLDRVGSKYDKVYINQVGSLTFAKASENDEIVTYKVSYSARESFDLDVQLTRRFGQLNPTFAGLVLKVDKKTRKVASFGTPSFSIVSNVEQWTKADPKGTSLSEKKTDRVTVNLVGQNDFSLGATTCQLPQGKLDLKFAANGKAANSSPVASSDDDDEVTHFESVGGWLKTDDGVSVDQGTCAAGSSNLDPQQAGFLADFEPLFMN